MLADSGANHGFALTFDSEAEFFSSECAGGKPRLELTLEPAAPTTGGNLAVELITPDSNGYTARIRNLGNEPVNGVKATWTIEAREGSTLEIPGAIAPGQIK